MLIVVIDWLIDWLYWLSTFADHIQNEWIVMKRDTFLYSSKLEAHVRAKLISTRVLHSSAQVWIIIDILELRGDWVSNGQFKYQFQPQTWQPQPRATYLISDTVDATDDTIPDSADSDSVWEEWPWSASAWQMTRPHYYIVLLVMSSYSSTIEL